MIVENSMFKVYRKKIQNIDFPELVFQKVNSITNFKYISHVLVVSFNVNFGNIFVY